MSMVETSAQWTSSRNNTNGRADASSWRSAAISRISRSADPLLVSASSLAAEDSSGDIGAICTNHPGATCFITVASVGSRLIRLSSASRNGRCASAPARRSEHRPRPIHTGVAISARKSSTSVLFPMPGSPETATSWPLPLSAASNAALRSERSRSRPTLPRRRDTNSTSGARGSRTPPAVRGHP